MTGITSPLTDTCYWTGHSAFDWYYYADDSTLVVLTGTVSPSHVIHHSRLTRYSVHPFSVSFSLPSLYSLTSPTFTQLMWVRVRV